jgi:hypothetical protein
MSRGLSDRQKAVIELLDNQLTATRGDGRATRPRDKLQWLDWVSRYMRRNIRLPGLVTADAIHAACKALIEAGWLATPARGGFQQKPRGVYPVSLRPMELLS